MAGMRLLVSLLGFLVAVKHIQTADPSFQDVTEKLKTTTLLESVKDAKRLVDASYKQTQESLKERLKQDTLSPADLFVLSRQPSERSREAIRAADYLHVTLELLKEKLKEEILEDFKLHDVLTSDHVQTICKASGCTQQEKLSRDCDEKSPYRMITGECNNLRSPFLGASNRPYVRWLPQVYEDGVSVPRGWTENKRYSGFPLPSVRAVSNEIVSSPNDRFTEDQQRSVMFMQWGQFTDHDLDLGLAQTTGDCSRTCDKVPPCFPIKVPLSDPRSMNISCLPFTRAAPVCDGKFAIRNQINVLTAFLDGSQVYGSEVELADTLRGDGGLMAVNQLLKDKDLAFLPFQSINRSTTCLKTDPEHKIPCFFAGDVRVDEMPALTVLHTLFLREHNRLVTELKRLNLQWDKETLYYEARKIVGAVMQKITYNDYLPELLGATTASTLKRYQGYNSTVDPRIASVFTNAFRFGHASVRPAVNRLDASYRLVSRIPLQRQFMSPWSIIRLGGIDPVLRGMLAKPAKLFRQDQFVVDALRNHLFEQTDGIGMDLPSLNMQRGRDHGLPAYNAWRSFCGLSQPRNEAELGAVLKNPSLAKKFINLYGTPENIDLWVGAVAEPLVPNGRGGPLLSCIIGRQFKNLRDGDRFWWENPGVFTPDQRKAISAVSLSRIICDNSHLREVPRNVFRANRYPQDFVNCNAIPRLSLFAWKKK